MSTALESVSGLLDNIIGIVTDPESRIHILACLGASAHDMPTDELTKLVSRFIAADMLMLQLASAPNRPLVHLIGLTVASYYGDDAVRLGISIGDENYISLVKYVNAALGRTYAPPQSVH